MNLSAQLAAGSGGVFSPLLGFLLVVSVAFLLCLVAGMSSDSMSDFFLAERDLSLGRNTVALFGDSISTTVLLSSVGACALAGFDGMFATVSLVAGMGVLLLLAGPLRATGGFTLGDILASRLPGRSTRIAAAIVSMTVSVPLLIIQLNVAGDATAYVLGLENDGVGKACTALIGLLMVSFAAFGGMRGISMIQVGKILLLLATVAVLGLAVARHFHWDLGSIVTAAGQQGGGADIFYSPGRLYGSSSLGRLDLYSMGFTIALGSVTTPHILLRVSAFRDTRAARRGPVYALAATTLFVTAVVLAGLSAAAAVGSKAVLGADGSGYSALFLLSDRLSGDTGRGLLFTLVACAVFLAALSTSAAVLLSGAAALTHDLYAQAWRRDEVAEQRVVSLTRWTITVLGSLLVGVAVALHSWNIASLTGFVTTTTASTILPALFYRFFWRGLTRRGLLMMLYGSVACCLVLEVFSTSVSGEPISLLPGRDFAWIPLHNVAVVTVPISFLLGWIGSLVTPERAMQERSPAENVDRWAGAQ